MFASTAFGQLRYVQESQPGIPWVVAATNLRTTGPTTKAAVQSVVSNEITSKRMVTSSTNVDLSVDGGFNFELSAQEYDPFLAGVLGGDWVGARFDSQPGVSQTTMVHADQTGSVRMLEGVGAAWVENLNPGQWFRVIPSDSAPYTVREYFANKWFKVGEGGAYSSVIYLDPSTPLDGAGAGIFQARIASSTVVNGSKRSSFLLEWYQSDVEQYLTYRGMRPNTLSLDFSVGAILTGSFGFFGQSHGIGQVSEAELFGPSQPSFAGDVMNSVTNMGILSVGGKNLLDGGASFIHNCKLEITNNLRGQKALGVFGNAGVGYGDFAVSGTLEAYFQNEELYEAALRGDNTTLALGVTDGAGNGYLFEMPKIKFTNPSLNLGGKDSDVMVSLPFQAFFDQSKGYGISITRAVVPTT